MSSGKGSFASSRTSAGLEVDDVGHELGALHLLQLDRRAHRVVGVELRDLLLVELDAREHHVAVGTGGGAALTSAPSSSRIAFVRVSSNLPLPLGFTGTVA